MESKFLKTSYQELGLKDLNLVLETSCQDFFDYESFFVFENTSLVIIFKAYRPLIVNDFSVASVGNYYGAHQELYQKTNEALAEIRKIFPTAKLYGGSYKTLLLTLGFSSQLKNSLLFIKPFGSFFCFEVIDKFGDFSLDKKAEIVLHKNCESCNLCQNACPNKALTGEGIIREKCLRDLQNKVPSVGDEKIIKLLKNKVLGCNYCQLACPINKPIFQKAQIPNNKYLELFSLDNFLLSLVDDNFKTSEYAKIFGKNYLKPIKFLIFTLNAMLYDDPKKHLPAVKKCLEKNNPNAKPHLKKYIEICENLNKT